MPRLRPSSSNGCAVNLLAGFFTVIITVVVGLFIIVFKIAVWLWGRGKYGPFLSVAWVLLVAGFLWTMADRSPPAFEESAPSIAQEADFASISRPKPFPSALPTAPRTPTRNAVALSVKATDTPLPPKIETATQTATRVLPADTPAPRFTATTASPSSPTWTPLPTATPAAAPTRRPTATATPPPTATPNVMVAVVIDTANLRAGPGTDYAKVGIANVGEKLEVANRTDTGEWVQLVSGAWIFAELVQVEAPQGVVANAQGPPTATSTATAPNLGWAVVQTNVLTVQQAPDASAAVIGSLSYGDCVAIVSARPQWLQVRYSGEATGWCSSEFVAQTAVCPTPAPVVRAPSGQVAAYVGTPLKPNATAVGNVVIHECFGSGDSPLRNVSAGTPVQILGVGDFQPPADQAAALGSGPFIKIRLWDGQVAWMAASAVAIDRTTLAQVAGVCETYDRMDWAQVEASRPPPPTPTWSVPAPVRSAPSQACCKICTKGKACGDTCISRSYTCHVGPGCACNG